MPEHSAIPRSHQAASRWFVASRLVLGVVLVISCAKLVHWLLEPPDVERIYQRGLDAMKADDLGAVQVAAEALAGLKDTEPYVHVLEGAVRLRSGRLAEAVAEFLQAREHPQTRAVANTLAGEALYRNQQFGDAIRALETAVRLDDSMTDAHRRLAAVLYDIGATGPAVKELRTVSQQAPDDPRPHRLLGLIYKDMESYPLAIVEYREALRRDPNLPEREKVLLELAECLLKMRRHEELAETIRQCPRSADALAMQAESQYEQGDSESAGNLVEEALRLAPDHFGALLIKGDIQLASGAAEKAAETLRRAADQRPHDFRARYRLSRAYARLGQSDLASEQAREVTRLRNLRSRFADLHANASADTADGDLRYQLGVVAAELGRPDLALSWFAAAVALDPNHVRAREALRLGAATPTGNHQQGVEPSTE